MSSQVGLIKLGGSIITNKDKPLTANHHAITDLAKSISRIKRPLILVHGGGSFGHYWSVKFDMHTKPEKYSSKGISIVHSSMLDLNKIINEIFEKEGLYPYSVPPFSFLNNGKPSRLKIKELEKMTEHNIIPITYGDVVHMRENKYSILSGDVIMRLLSNILNPYKAIFTINVDGLYNNLIEKKIIQEIKPSTFNIKNKKIIMKQLGEINDVTGGMKRKVEEAIKIAQHGNDVIFLNGLHPSNLEKVFKGKKIKGTIFKANKK